VRLTLPGKSGDPVSDSRARLAVCCVYASVLLVALDVSAIVPLIPALGRRLDLGPVWSATLLALPSATVLLTSMPLAAICDRLGARRLTLVAGASLLASYCLQAMPTLLTVAGGRLLCGLSFALVWSAALVWLSDLHQALGNTGSHLGATVTAGSVGTAIGPALAGVLTEAAGFSVPFIVAGALTAVVVAGIVLAGPVASQASAQGQAPSGSRPDPDGIARQRTRRRRSAAGHPRTVDAAWSLAMSGIAGGVVQLVAPLQLSALGETSSHIGTSVSVASIVYIATSAVVVRRGQAVITRTFNAVAALGIAVCMAPALAGRTSVAIEAVLFLTAVPRASIGTLAYPLAASGVETGRRARAFAQLNTMWAAAMLLAPLAAGISIEHAGVVWTYVATATVLGVAGLALCLRVLASRSRSTPGVALQPNLSHHIRDIKQRRTHDRDAAGRCSR